MWPGWDTIGCGICRVSAASRGARGRAMLYNWEVRQRLMFTHQEGHVTTRQWLNHVAVGVPLIISVTGVSQPQLPPASGTSAGVEAVWAREQQYWRFVQSGDVDNYRAIWDDSFRGWPC